MLATESQQSLLRRSSSIWRRFSRRDRRSQSPEDATPTPPPPPASTQRQHQNKLQKRNHLIAHMMHRIDSPTDRRRSTPIKPAPSRVLSSHMKTTPFPDDPSLVHTVSWNVFVTPEQIHRLFMGFRPEQMEDKWFIYSEGPDRAGKLKVHFFRSWTGIKIAELFVVIDLKGEGAGKIVGIKWNASDQTNAMDEEEAKYMITTTCAWVLKVDLEKQGSS